MQATGATNTSMLHKLDLELHAAMLALVEGPEGELGDFDEGWRAINRHQPSLTTIHAAREAEPHKARAGRRQDAPTKSGHQATAAPSSAGVRSFRSRQILVPKRSSSLAR